MYCPYVGALFRLSENRCNIFQRYLSGISIQHSAFISIHHHHHHRDSGCCEAVVFGRLPPQQKRDPRWLDSGRSVENAALVVGVTIRFRSTRVHVVVVLLLSFVLPSAAYISLPSPWRRRVVLLCWSCVVRSSSHFFLPTKDSLWVIESNPILVGDVEDYSMHLAFCLVY